MEHKIIIRKGGTKNRLRDLWRVACPLFEKKGAMLRDIAENVFLDPLRVHLCHISILKLNGSEKMNS